MKLEILAIISILSSLLVAVKAGPGNYSLITKCSDLPKETLDVKTMIDYSPFIDLAETNKTSGGGTFVYTHPPTEANHQFSVIYMKNGNYVVFDVIFSPDNKSNSATLCSNGQTMTWNSLESNFAGSNSYHCAYHCSSTDPTKLAVIVCMGRTASDQQNVHAIVSSLENLAVASGLTITSYAIDSNKGKYCPLFTQ